MTLAIGRREDAESYENLFGKISAAFVAKYVGGDGRMDPETQTGYALALRFELLPQDLRVAAARHLAADIEGRGRHLSSGVVGLSLIAPALTEAGRTDVAYRLLTNETYPS
jgi:alpha-L-rhamnosidase